MFEHLPGREEDKIIGLIKAFASDPRADKIDLGVGVYRTETGETPIFRAVKLAERSLVDVQETKGYVALGGDPDFHSAIRDLVLGDAVSADRVSAIATPGGTGAVRQGFEMLKLAHPETTVWVSYPTWVNHPSILGTLGLRDRPYRYFDPTTCSVDIDGMMKSLEAISAGDIVLLHGCCHNPTGADLKLDDWQALTDLLSRKGAIPFIDIAYQGFGDGLEQDAAGLRHMVSQLPEAVITVSGSKNFGMYRDRVGAVLAIGDTAAKAMKAGKVLIWLNRQNYAFPPDHGARVVTDILRTPALRSDWEAELEAMRLRIQANRKSLAKALQEHLQSDRFGFLTDHKGMFSLLGISTPEVTRLRTEFSTYMVDDGRINLAGVTAQNAKPIAQAIASVLNP